MRTRNLATAAITLGLVLLYGSPAKADTVLLKDGTSFEGVIKKVEKGTVFITIGNEEKSLDMLVVESMDFNTPHLQPTRADLPVDHFLKDIEAQEIVRNMKEIESTAEEVRRKLGQIRTYWMAKQPISTEEQSGWAAAKEDFRRPLSRYQELLNDLYFHVLAKVDEYDLIVQEANKVYVGVKGIRIGSALVAKEGLPLRNYVPGAWYDTIYYDGYNMGYNDAYSKINGGSPKSD